ncbi:hypothetical protein GCM10010124_16070 [Pilimelia terevasa]|uniref:histidine kinase n=1 Tax=Pilimelia terevasa TaxID=53372 RepID=A0A8J3BIV2_9ACTN|nr:HAMP domain-containing sensor histidine kinase [Pilimelia terevasa]GGK24347.1 hypothetical protein GCM10010124_16070 [Pilimelia terevasa]
MAAAEIFRWGSAVINLGMLTYAVGAYVRHRDALRGLLVLLYATGLTVSAVEAYVRLSGRPSGYGVATAGAVYLFHPIMTLLLASFVHRVPRAVVAAAFAGATLLTFPLVAYPKPGIPAVGLGYVVFFVTVETAAARIFAAEARRRRGTSAVRLRSASLAAWALILVLLLAVLGGIAGLTSAPTNDVVAVRPGGVVVVLLSHFLLAASAVGYLLAFAPPRLLRQVWEARALRTVSRRLLDAPPTETPTEVWRRYTDVVRDVTGADAADVVLCGPEGGLVRPGDDPHHPTLPADLVRADLSRLLRVDYAVALRPAAAGPRQAGAGGPLADFYAGTWDGAFLTAVPIAAPRVREGALVVVNRRRGLFAGDDLRLLADLAAQAAVLAERGAVVQRQQRLTDELAASVAALTQASRAKTDFLAAMSHELRTPLHAIIGFSDLLGDDLAGDPVHAEWVGHIQRGGYHLLTLINGLLDLAKVESGQVDLRRAPLRLDTAIVELLATLRPMLARKNLQLVSLLAPVTASVDALRFRQIVENLLSNAIKFTAEEGRITVSLGVEGRDVTVSVADTGVGIAAEDQPMIFEAFQQVRTADKRGGTGLGLALGRRLAQAHGGDLHLQSAVGLGSTLTLSLPDSLVAGDAPPDGAVRRLPHPGDALPTT